MAKVRILSYSGEPFQSRIEAGQLLAQELTDLKGKKAVVLGIPRGGIIIARELAEGIGADLDISISRKIGAPGQLELALGALAENGEVFLNQRVMAEMEVSENYVLEEKARQMAEIRRRSQLFRAILPKIPLKGRVVVVTDDGVATGATMQAAVWAIRRENPQELIAAIPVASEEAVTRLAQDVDELVCLRLPSYFAAVGQFYRQFTQITDEQVLEILKQERERKKET